MNQLTLFPLEIFEDNFTPDDYETPDYVAEAMSKLVLPSDRSILEPFAGTGQISKFLPDDRFVDCFEIKGSRVAAGKINAPKSRWLQADFFDLDFTLLPRKYYYDLIITNPPFSLCLKGIRRSLSLLNNSPESRLLFLMPIDWYCSKRISKQWEELDAHIHHIYPIKGRVDYLKNGERMSKQQKFINGVPQFKADGSKLMNSGRQVYDAVFDIRVGNRHSITTFLV